MKVSKFLKTKRDKEIYNLCEKCKKILRAKKDYRTFLPTTKDPTLHKNWKFFSDLYDLLNELDIDADAYLEAVFHRTYDEQISDRKIYPSMLATEWALLKYISLSEKKKEAIVKTPNKFELKLEAIAMSKKTVDKKLKDWGYKNGTLRDFFTHIDEGEIFPHSLYLVNSGVVSKVVASCSKSFWEMLNKQDDDVKEEFIDINELSRIRLAIASDEKLISALKETFSQEEII